MKRIMLLLLLAGFGCMAQSQSANTASELFERGNEAYKKQDYGQAAELYRQILEKGHESAPLYYNLGNTYFKMGQMAEAILNYERAARLDPGDEDTRQNLKVVRQGVIDRFEEMPKPLVKQAYLGIMLSMSSNTWAWLSIVFLAICVAGVSLYLFTSLRRPGFIGLSSGLILALICFAMAYANDNYHENNRAAIVMQPSSYVKSAPSSSSEDVFILHEGTKATVTDQLEGWKKIRVPDGKIGWIRAEDIEEV